MAKSRLKPLFYTNRILRVLYNITVFEKKEIKVYNKNFKFNGLLSGKQISIHKGNYFIRHKFNFLTGFHKIGEYCITRKPFHYPTKQKKKK